MSTPHPQPRNDNKIYSSRDITKSSQNVTGDFAIESANFDHKRVKA